MPRPDRCSLPVPTSSRCYYVVRCGTQAERYPSDNDWGVYGWTYSLYGGEGPGPVALKQAQDKAGGVG